MPYTSVTNIFLRMTNPRFSLWKKCHPIISIFHSDYSNVLTSQIDFCFPKLCFAPFIRTQIEYFNKQLLIDIAWRFESQRWVCTAKNMFCYTRYHLKKHNQVYKLVNNKIFSVFNSSTKHMILDVCDHTFVFIAISCVYGSNCKILW